MTGLITRQSAIRRTRYLSFGFGLFSGPISLSEYRQNERFHPDIPIFLHKLSQVR